jgi:hypothetical protein
MSNTEKDPDQMTAAQKDALVASTRRFDLRRILGALFLVYGVIVTIIGIVNFSSDVHRTEGIAINLWTGIAMLILAGLFLLWNRLAPVPAEDILHSIDLEAEQREVGEGRKVG